MGSERGRPTVFQTFERTRSDYLRQTVEDEERRLWLECKRIAVAIGAAVSVALTFMIWR